MVVVPEKNSNLSKKIQIVHQFKMEMTLQLQAVEGYLRQFNVILDYKKKGSVRPISDAQIETLMKVEGIDTMFTNATISKLDILLKQGWIPLQFILFYLICYFSFCEGAKIAATNQVHFLNQDDLSAWFQDTFVFGLEDAEGQKIINFSCVSKQGLELFLKSFVSEDGDKRVNGLTRMWKIYGAHTTQRWAAMSVMFNTLQSSYSVGALASSANMRIGRTSYDISSRLFPQGKKKMWFGMTMEESEEK